jgi:hypothetical protein
LSSSAPACAEDSPEVRPPLCRDQAQVHPAVREVQEEQEEHAAGREARAREDAPAQRHRDARNGGQQRGSLQRQEL